MIISKYNGISQKLLTVKGKLDTIIAGKYHIFMAAICPFRFYFVLMKVHCNRFYLKFL